MKQNAIFVAATGQNVGKTTICLGLISGLLKRFDRVGFIKPVGQIGIEISQNLNVDKDVALFKKYFNLKDRYEDMSPVLVPNGFTKRYLDGEVSHESLIDKIRKSYDAIQKNSDVVVVEGTGHSGVGSIIGLNNAKVAAELGLDCILIASGGLGSAFDDLELNKTMFEAYGVKVIGVILNRVIQEKREMILDYFNKAVRSWNIPLMGCIPYDDLLSEPTMRDFEGLFGVELIAGKEHGMRHFHNMRFVASKANSYEQRCIANELVITSAEREDIILATIELHEKYFHTNHEDMQGGMILTGAIPPSDDMIDKMQQAHIPTLYVPISNYKAMQKVTSFTSKIRAEDVTKIEEATSLMERYINFDNLNFLHRNNSDVNRSGEGIKSGREHL